MAQARSRLFAGEGAVMRVASDLGYANASHFATVFRKKFGVNPSEIRFRGREASMSSSSNLGPSG
ncbi:AraC family transcriptional regulator [Stutzerimonas frequens]|uniref:AraC family transcriptional regulator n=1 Tax=Stutzerimonas frequens TaxID=2968969 RepID=UPI002934E665|nr:AraC family transcriptional regulator [Stutzerimonas frequens]WOC81078.1 AraC family transcriptional regulator [Stutzerimonas frequens]